VTHADAPLRLVVFDVDGTLIDSQALIAEAMSRAFAAIGEPAPARAEVLEIVGLSLPVAIGRLAPRLDAATLEAAVAAYRAAFFALREEMGGEASSPLYPGALEVLARLGAREALLLGVATGKARRGLDHVIASHGLGGRFHTLQTADLHPSKPHPSMLLAALDETGVEARHAAMVGDTTFDMEMARAAGLTPVGVAWGYHAAERLREAGAAAVIEHFDQLDDVLGGLWAERAA
jgi:phosphoglycolate phosphatase